MTMGFPGLDIDTRGEAWLNPEALDMTLGKARAANIDLLMILPFSDELPDGVMQHLRQELLRHNLRSVALPITDFDVPSQAFMRAWHRLSPVFQGIYARGGTVGICCYHGAGRSGVVAAMHLICAGMPPGDAVQSLRNQFPETVENARQYDWLVDFSYSM